MEHDDHQVGRILNRREALGLIAAGGAAGLAAGPLRAAPPDPFRLPACVARPQQTEGPYFIDERLDRRDIRSDPTNGSIRDGAPLRLAFHVSRIDGDGCRPLPGALVDVWQCDAAGIYAGVEDIAGQFDTRGEKFLRGYQMTDADGMVEFLTIYPGWYQGRAIHIHFKIRTDPEAEAGTEFTSQVYFDEAFNDEVMAKAPYSANPGERVMNERDGIYQSGGHQLLLDVFPDGEGYAAAFDIGLNITEG